MGSSHAYTRLGVVAVLGLAMAAWLAAGCGGSSGSTAATTTTDSGDGTTLSTASLSTVPSTDISQLDSSQSTASANVSAGKSMGLMAGKEFDDNSAGNFSSFAGCMVNTIKQQAFMSAQMPASMLCHIMGMNLPTVGLVTIPSDGSLAIYKVDIPEDTESRGDRCGGIPEEDTEGKRACESGDDDMGGKTILLRMGVIGGALQVDMCLDGRLREEQTYTVTDRTTVTAHAIHTGSFSGHDESSDTTVTATGVKSISSGVLSLDTGGIATAAVTQSGRYGSGYTSLSTDGSVVTISGSFNSNFTDHFTGKATSAAHKVYAQVGPAAAGSATIVGSAKFSSIGRQKPILAESLIPFDIPRNQVTTFLSLLGREFGLPNLAGTDLLCPSSKFDPTSRQIDRSIIPFQPIGDDGECESVTQTGTENFSVSNTEVDSHFGSKIVVQTFQILNTTTPFDAAVAAFDFATLPAVGTIAYQRAWDCSGNATSVNFSGMTAAQAAAFQTAEETCSALDMKLHSNQGAGGSNCQEKAGSNIGSRVKDSPDVGDGYVAGGYSKTGTTCPVTITIPDKMVINDMGSSKDCIPNGRGDCGEFTTSENLTISGLSIEAPIPPVNGSHPTITQLVLTETGSGQNKKVSSLVETISSGGSSCTINYNRDSAIDFTSPGVCTEVTDACKANGITDCGKCGDFCAAPSQPCGSKLD